MDPVKKLAEDIRALRKEVRELKTTTEESAHRGAKDVVQRAQDVIDELRSAKEQMVFGQKKPSYTNKELADLFGVTTKTIKKWRDEGYLGFSQIGSVYQYSPNDIAELLKHTHFDPSMFISKGRRSCT